MATIDQLQIEISASARQAESSIDKLIGSLKKLNTNLNLDFGTKLSTNLANLNTSLSTLSLTIDGFDSGKLKDIASSFRSLSNLSNLTTRTAKTINKNVSSISSDATRLSREIAKKFNITDAEGLQQLDAQFVELEKAIKGGLNTNAIEKSIEDIVKSYGSFSDMSKMARDSFLDFKNAIREAGGFSLEELGSGWMSEFANPERARGIFGIKDVRKNTKQTVEEFVNQFNNATHGKRYDLSQNENPANILNQMVKDYDQIEADMSAVSESEYRNTGAAQAMAEAMANVKTQFHETKTESQELAQSLEAIPNISEKITPVGGTDALEEIILNLRELSTLNLSAENLSGITTLADAMGRLGGKNATGAAQYIKPIAEGLRELPEVVPAGENYIQLANGLAKLGGVKVQSAAGLTEVARGIRALRDIGTIPNMAGLTELGQALSVFGRQTAQNAVVVIPQIANAFRQLIQTLSTAPRISRSVIDLANAMANLTANAGRANTAVSRTSPLLNNLGNSATRAKKSFGGLAATIGKIYATYWLLFRAFGKIKEAINFGSALVEVQNVVDTVFGDAKKKVESFADSAITSFGLSELSAKQFASKYQAMGSAMGITNAQVVKANTYLDKALEGSKRKVDGYTDSYKKLGTTLADMSINMTKLTADVGSFYNMDYEEVATKMASVWTGQTRPMREFGVDLTQTTLQEWMLNRGIDGNIKKMTQAEKTMIRYQYVMEQLGHVMNDYARTADTWANVTRTIGEQFRKLGGIVGTGFINAFRPALVKFRDFMNTMIDMVEKGLNAIGKLLGWQIEISEVGLTEDADAVGDIADGLGDAAGNAKKLNEQLMGFDRLNNITTPKDKSGSGSGSGATGGGGGASQKATDPKVTWKAYESEIKSWFELGEAISGKVADALENIKWDDIKKKAEKFGKNLADLMNGQFAGEQGARLFKAMGSTIAEAINTVMTAAKTWADELEWGKIGENIKDGLVLFLKKWEPEITGEAVGGIVSGIANAVYAMVSDKESWKLLGTKISEGINSFLKRMGKKDKTTGKTGWQAAFGSVGSIIDGIGNAIKEAIEKIEWDEFFAGLWDGIKEFFNSLTVDGVIGLIGGLVLLKAGITVITALKTGMGLLKTITFTPFFSIGAPEVTKSFTLKALWKSIAEAIGFGSAGIGMLTAAATLTVSAAVIWYAASGKDKENYEQRLSGFGLDKNGKRKDGKKNTKQDDINRDYSKRLSGAFTANAAMSANDMWMMQSAKNKIDNTFYGKLYEKTAQKNDTGFSNIGTEIAAGIAKGITTWWSDNSKSKSLIERIKDALKEAAGIHSPATEFYDIGDYIGQGMFEGLKEWLKNISFVKFITDWQAKLTADWGDFALDVKNAFKTTKENVKKWYTDVKKWWGTKKLDIANKFTTLSNDVSEWYNTVKGWWGEKKLDIKNKFETTKENVQSWFDKVSGWWDKVKKKLGIDTKNTTQQTDVTGWFSTIKGWWGTPKLEVAIDFVKDAVNNLWSQVQRTFNNNKIEVSTKEKKTALGGAYYNGKWHNIAQFASGGRPSHGSMFVAGENGAEVVGHIGGRSEVLNESQMASVMYDAVSDAMATQNAILIKQNQLLSGILAKDYGISSSDIFAATQREASNYTMRTGRPAFN